MAHFAKIKDDIVIEVVVSEQSFINSGYLGDSFEWVQCSYHENFRGLYPKEGFVYDRTSEKFFPPKPFLSWIWDQEIKYWKAPVDQPSDGVPHWISYLWNEDSQTWVRQPDPDEGV